LEVITRVARKMKFLWLPQNHFKRMVSLKHGDRFRELNNAEKWDLLRLGIRAIFKL